MTQSIKIRIPLAGFLILVMCLMLPSCSDDPGTPQNLGEEAPPWDPDLPTLPVADNAQDPLPEVSGFLTMESAFLQNFSPRMSGATPFFLNILNEAHVLDFRLPASRNLLFREGKPCFPEHLEWTEGTDWNGLERTTTGSPFVSLGNYGGSSYYLCQTPTHWMFADLNCRNFGGHLAALNSAEEHSYLFAAVQNIDPSLHFFIGLTDWGQEDEWAWTSGETFDWNNWNAGEPNNAGPTGEQFAIVYNTGEWNDTPAQSSYAYVMERTNPLPLVIDDEVSCAITGTDLVYLNEIAAPGKIPHIERRLYWKKVFQVTLEPGTTYDQDHSYIVGVSAASGQAFGHCIGVPDTADWVFTAGVVQTELSEGFNREITLNVEEPLANNYSATAPNNKTMLVALWQLRERFNIVDSLGNQWSDPKYYMDGYLPYLDQGLPRDYLQTVLFDQP